MLFEIIDSVMDRVVDAFDGTDNIGDVDSGDLGDASSFNAGSLTISSEVQATLDELIAPGQTLNDSIVEMLAESNSILEADLAAIESMSPAELDIHMAETEAKIAFLDGQIRTQGIISDIESSVNEYDRKLIESKGKSFGTGLFTPFESGITLDNSNVPHDISEFTVGSDGLLEKDGKFYKKYGDGVYHETSAGGVYK